MKVTSYFSIFAFHFKEENYPKVLLVNKGKSSQF